MAAVTASTASRFAKLQQTKDAVTHILAHYEKFTKVHHIQRPMVVGVSGCQGSGKTTLCNTLESILSKEPYHLNVVNFSLDDVYLTHHDQVNLSQSRYPSNPLYRHRGQAGSHDLALLRDTFKSLLDSNSTNDVRIPVYDKSKFKGEGDRLDVKDWKVAQPPFDIILFEGWMNGFKPLPSSAAIDKAVQEMQLLEKLNLPLQPEHLYQLNDNLAPYETDIYPFYDTFIHLSPENIQQVYQWRLEQEHNMIAIRQVEGLSDEQVKTFVDTYMPAYALYLPRLDQKGFFDNQTEQDRYPEVVAFTRTRKKAKANHNEYSIGDIVFAKLKGFPWWPGRIEDNDGLPEHILEVKQKAAKSAIYTVFFFGSNDYGFFAPKDVRPFVPETVRKELEAEKFKTKELKEAILRALDPNFESDTTVPSHDSEVDEEVKEIKKASKTAAKTEEVKPKRKRQPTKKEDSKKEEVKAATTIRSTGRKKATQDASSEPASPLESDNSELKATTTIRATGRKRATHSASPKIVTPSESENSSDLSTGKATRGRRRTKNVKTEEEESSEDKLSRKELMVDKKAKALKTNGRATKKDNTKPATTKRNPKRARTTEPDVASLDNIDRKRKRGASGTVPVVEPVATDEMEIENGSARPFESNGSFQAQYEYIDLTPEQVGEFKKSKDFIRIYQMRHRLQKFVHNKKPGEIPESDYVSIASVVTDIEREKNMTINLLKYTKIGKVIKFAALYDFGVNDRFNISERCHQLMRKWKHLVVELQRESVLQLAQQQGQVGGIRTLSSGHRAVTHF